jgi:thermitase
MNRVLASFVALLLIVAALSVSKVPAWAVVDNAAAARPAPLQTFRTADGREAVVGRILVGYHDNVVGAERRRVHETAARRGISNAMAVQAVGTSAEAVDIEGAPSLDDALRTYRADPRVRYAEPEYVHHALATPNDPYFSRQWGLERMQAPAAWDVTHGSFTVHVAVLDTGIYDEASTRVAPDGGLGHPDLRGKVSQRQNFTSDATTDDEFGHGTHVAGIIGANTNNGVGVASVGYDTGLLNVKVLNSAGSGSESWIANGIRWATDHGAQVINLSLGSAGACSATMRDAVTYAWTHNVVVVAAAGNDGTARLESPASCPNVLAVASTDATDTMTPFSTHGRWVHVAAPGGYDALGNGIWSTSMTGDYGYEVGTSMAAAHVSGLAALVWATAWGTTNAAVVNRIISTADAVPGTGTQWHFGRVNARAAVSPASSAPTATPSPLPTSTPTPLPTNTPTLPPTSTPTLPPSSTPTAAPTNTPTPLPTSTPTSTPLPTSTPTSTPLPTSTPTPTPASTQTPTSTPSPAEGHADVDPSDGDWQQQKIVDSVSAIDGLATPSILPTNAPTRTL